MGFDSSQLLKAILNSVDAAILMVDSNLKVVMCNRKFEEFWRNSSLILNQDKERQSPGISNGGSRTLRSFRINYFGFTRIRDYFQ